MGNRNLETLVQTKQYEFVIKSKIDLSSHPASAKPLTVGSWTVTVQPLVSPCGSSKGFGFG